jgi:hypothetical protein
VAAAQPARGGFSRIAAGADRIRDERDARRSDGGTAEEGDGQPGGQTAPEREGLAERPVRQTDIEPQSELLLLTDPTHRPVWWAMRYVLRVRTNIVISVASALGYAAGLEYTFLIFLIPLVIAGFLALAPLRIYRRGVATASASVNAINDSAGRSGEPGSQQAA